MSLSCDFIPVEEDADRVADCAERTHDGHIQVRPRVLMGRTFNAQGVAEILVDGELLFVNRSGRTAPALPFDNGADLFVEGFARTLRNGKVGFVNPDLTEVIAAQWDFAFPFESGRAVVCQGCSARPVTPGGEHREVVGGMWGYIDRSGAVIVPLQYPHDALPFSGQPANPALQPAAAKPAAAER